MNNQVMVDKAQGCLMGVNLGDAMGMSVETLTHEQILAATGGVGIRGFVDSLSKRDWLKELKAGDATDDWQLTRAVANSLIRCGGQFNLIDCAEEHVRELRQSTFGWGKTTQLAIEAIGRGERVPGRDALPPAEPGKGCGNGVVMKVAPLALMPFDPSPNEFNRGLWRDVKALGSLTHPDIRASVAAYAVALTNRLTAIFSLTQKSLSTRLNMLSVVIRLVSQVEEDEGITTELVSRRLRKLSQSIYSAQDLRKAVGCGFHAIDTAAFAIGTFFRHPTDFRAGVLEAVNAGGDTDTNASVVGGLIGANVGIQGIPEEWIDFRPHFREALELGEKLCVQ